MTWDTGFITGIGLQGTVTMEKEICGRPLVASVVLLMSQKVSQAGY